MKRALTLCAIFGIFSLLACDPPEETEKDSGPKVEKDAGLDCDPNGVSESQLCNDTDKECACGLDCVKIVGETSGICMVLCDNAEKCEATETCGEGDLVEMQREASIPTFPMGQNMCIDTLQRADNCYTVLGACAEGLECFPSSSDDDNDDGVQDHQHCQEMCEYGGAATCTNSEESCVGNGAGFVQPEMVAAGNDYVWCGGDLGDCSPGADCPCSAGYDCGTLTFTSSAGEEERDVCYRPTGVCGTTVEIITAESFDSAISGGIPETLREFICDPSSATVCDETLGGVDNPSAVQCVGIFSDAPYAGFCLGLCGIPDNDNNGEYEFSDCPEGWACKTDPAFFYATVDNNGADVPCTDDSSCVGYDNAECAGPFGDSTTTVCARPFGLCGEIAVVEDAGTPDAYTAPDATTMEDATVLEDAAVMEDAMSMEDAFVATPDAYTPEDASTPDTNMSVEDASTPDTMTVVEDAGMEDASTEDA